MPRGHLLHHLLRAGDEGKDDRRDPANVFKQPGGEEAWTQRTSLTSLGNIFYLFYLLVSLEKHQTYGSEEQFARL